MCDLSISELSVNVYFFLSEDDKFTLQRSLSLHCYNFITKFFKNINLDNFDNIITIYLL